MATICDSCFTTDTGIGIEADFPYDVDAAEQLYCVDGLLVAPPSHGAVNAGTYSWRGEGGLAGDGAAITMTVASGAAWANDSGRSASVAALVVVSASLGLGTGSGAYGVSFVATLTSSGGGSSSVTSYLPAYSTAIPTQIPVLLPSVTVAHGQSASLAVTATDAGTGTTTGVNVIQLFAVGLMLGGY